MNRIAISLLFIITCSGCTSTIIAVLPKHTEAELFDEVDEFEKQLSSYDLSQFKAGNASMMCKDLTCPSAAKWLPSMIFSLRFGLYDRAARAALLTQLDADITWKVLSISATKLGYSRAASYYEYLANSKFAIRCEYVGYKIEVVSSPCSHWRRTGYLIPTTISQPYPISVYDRHDNLRTYLDEQVKAILINIGVEKDVSDPVITFQRMLGERETGILTSSQLQALNDLLIALKIEQQYGFQTEDYQN